ncbi:MAG: hypothetical protein IJM67_04965 [Atopobiaceae bacterium]|jgi:hypothetical protein|nr:hypothetical protein [Kiritimatiellia bacterium]MBQ6650586.1 hypothetical protein [Atopobiaceae bacterium]
MATGTDVVGALSMAHDHPRIFDAAIWGTGDAHRNFGETSQKAHDRILREREEMRARAR